MSDYDPTVVVRGAAGPSVTVSLGEKLALHRGCLVDHFARPFRIASDQKGVHP